MSNRLAETGLPSASTCASTRCQPRGRTSILAIVSFSRYSRPSAVVCSRLCSTTSRSAAWPRMTFANVGESESSRSTMKQFAPELNALIIMRGSAGPVISTQRRSRSGGVGATRKSGSGAAPERRALARVERGLARLPRLEQRQAARAELALQALDQVERQRGQDLVGERNGRRQGQRHAGRSSATHGLRRTPTPSTSTSTTSPSCR